MSTTTSQTQGVAQRSESVAKEKRRPVRRDPDRRRQQNIQAQKKYREKLRERLDRLEALAASAVKSYDNEITQTADTGRSEACSTPIHIITPSLPVFAPNIWESTKSLDPFLLNYDEHNYAPESSVAYSSVTTSEDFQQLIPQPDESSSALRICDSTTSLDPSLLIRNRHNDGLDPYSTIAIDRGCSGPHFQMRTRGPTQSNPDEAKTVISGPSVSAPDPYASNLRIETICITAALYTLGVYIGITEEMMCAEKSLSPFFLSGAESADDMIQANAVCTVQNIFKTLKPDLRPGREQITVNHHPYIDVLPFPTLRKNLITHQEAFDEDEFFHDVLTGLVCWGGAGIGMKDRQASTGYAPTGTPWDVRSWEARVWFLKKYWSLLGGEDGELVRQSEWWRNMRGDDTLYNNT